MAREKETELEMTEDNIEETEDDEAEALYQEVKSYFESDKNNGFFSAEELTDILSIIGN